MLSSQWGVSIFSQSVSLTQYVVLPARLSVPVSLLSKRPSSFFLIHFVGTPGAARGQLGRLLRLVAAIHVYICTVPITTVHVKLSEP